MARSSATPGSPETDPPETGPGRSGASIDPDQVARFEAMAAEWWDPRGRFRPLHQFNPVRIGFIRDRLCDYFGRDPSARAPLDGLRLLDIGTGGGLVAEPLARLGARVTGIDPAETNIRIAADHCARQGLDIDYRATTAEDLAASGERFDVVLTLEVVEHVHDPAAFIDTAAGMVAPDGMLIAATLNRTLRAWLLAIVGAEYVLGWLPRGTHEWDRFLTPQELSAMIEASGLGVESTIGLSYNPLTSRWKTGGDTGVNYMLAAIRRPPADSR